jgi:hypothetical protein
LGWFLEGFDLPKMFSTYYDWGERCESSEGGIRMPATIVSQEGTTVTLQVTIDLGSQMLENEEKIQGALNEAGVLATRVSLERFDTDGNRNVSIFLRQFLRGIYC